MRIWLIGAEQAGAEAYQQFRKNTAIDVVVSDSIERPKAVTDRIIPRVDHVEQVTPMNVNQLARRIRPDLILIDGGALKRTLGRVSQGQVFAEALYAEIVAVSEYPCLVI
ncbi:MAG: hypothetical protein IPK16_28650 [Anaerolineales bacterium]|nr:hypothetical protein [Anaerolineales bacterium]